MVQRIQRRMPAKRLKEPDCPERSGAYEGESSLVRRTHRCTQRNPFPKKSGGILRKGNRREAYRFIDEHRNLFGVRWLLRRFGIYPNAYYNYRKHRRAKEDARRTSCVKFKPYTMKPMALPGTAGCRLIWHAKASRFLL